MNSVSIILPVRNDENFISDCLSSVLNFEGLDNNNYEILVVDGNSTDKTREKLELLLINPLIITLMVTQQRCLNIWRPESLTFAPIFQNGKK